jgi:pimeloyl-ACP methyl ester carboxylesterase
MDNQLVGWDLPNRRIFECDTKYEEYNHDLDKVVERFRKGVLQNSKKPIDMIGYSWGGFVAQEYAQRYPDDTSKIVLVNSFAKVVSIAETAAALKLLQETGLDTRVNEDTRDIENALRYDFLENDIRAPSFSYNCFFDTLIGGVPPTINGIQSITEMCRHEHTRLDEDGRISAMVREFLDGES